MADWIPIASLVLTPTIVAAYAYMQRQWEHRNSERSELRNALDEAASELNRAIRGVEILHKLYKEEAAPSAQWDEARERYRSLLGDTRTARDRLAIRIGQSSEVFKAYRAALDALDAYRKGVTRPAENGDSYDTAKPTKLRPALTRAHSHFLEAARLRAGTEDERRPIWKSKGKVPRDEESEPGDPGPSAA